MRQILVKIALFVPAIRLTVGLVPLHSQPPPLLLPLGRLSPHQSPKESLVTALTGNAAEVIGYLEVVAQLVAALIVCIKDTMMVLTTLIVILLKVFILIVIQDVKLLEELLW